jgi:AcrR family transcriptional regulator
MPKIVDHDQRRRDIIEVARRLILQGGFQAATMRSIAAEAGFANGALKHFFPGKDSIIAATFESMLVEMDPEGRLSARSVDSGLDPKDRLRNVIAEVLPSTEDEITAGRVLLVLWDHAASNPDLAELYRRTFDRWKAQLVTSIGEAAGPETRARGNYEAVAVEIMSITIGANVVNLMHPDGTYVPTYDEITDIITERISR